ncbi:hypothetical protein MPSEU_000473200 [Mayamaea pseudoterrestris]|nr:hypothetical protein MPSEU_000473200 [Mayamaea pseudoterrestris]
MAQTSYHCRLRTRRKLKLGCSKLEHVIPLVWLPPIVLMYFAFQGYLVSSFETSSTPKLMDASARAKLGMATTRTRWTIYDEDGLDELQKQNYRQRPIPVMPSPLFRELAQSQLELLATSLLASDRQTRSMKTKVRSMALYLPQENQETGQLQFIPAVLYPHPDSDRIFIAPESDSRGLTLPNVLNKLPGFAHASTLIPNYPMVSGSTNAGIGAVEEVFCDVRFQNSTAALSVPLFAGAATVGVLLVSPDDRYVRESLSFWTNSDYRKVAKAAQSLSLALSMDTERNQLAQKNRLIQEALSDSIHQLKNPIQALRTYGKLLQQRIADSEDTRSGRGSVQLLELVNHLMVQSDRVADRLGPVDSIVEALGQSRPMYALGPARVASIVPWSPNAAWETVANVGTASSLQAGDMYEAVESDGGSLAVVENIQLEMGFLDDMLSETISAFRAMATEQGIEFAVILPDELPGVMSNPVALQEVVSNLLDNAFKYATVPKVGSSSKVNSHPRVRLGFSANLPPAPAGVTVLVEDNGPGIPPSEYEAVFERCFRGSRTKHLIRGSGIGLDIVRSLVRRMNGIVRVVPNSELRPHSTYSGTVIELQLFRNAIN